MADNESTNKRKSSSSSSSGEANESQDGKRCKASEPDDLVFLNSAGKPVRVSREKMHEHKSAAIGNEKTRAVVATVAQALQEASGNGQLSELALARIAAEIFKRNLIYCDDQWHFSATTAMPQTNRDFCVLWQKGMARGETLLHYVGRVLVALIERFPRDQTTLVAAFTRLDDNPDLGGRVVQHLERLLWHSGSI